jgi:PTH1 family peptidyl-tRNA hydrolase
MKIIVGLGNPGNKYESTRHNVGFMAVDFMMKEPDQFVMAKPSHEFKSEMYTWFNGDQKVVFLKPQTYMNDSGQALKVICNFYKLDLAQDLLIIHDEVDLPFGTIRRAQNSSAAGHNGVQSIINEIGTQDFQRLRVGIEARASREEMPTDAFVLQNFTDAELEKVRGEILPEIKKMVLEFLNSTPQAEK